MAVVYLVRHGQASFGAADYDVLSDAGRRQAAVLGRGARAPRRPAGPRGHRLAAPAAGHGVRSRCRRPASR